LVEVLLCADLGVASGMSSSEDCADSGGSFVDSDGAVEMLPSVLNTDAAS